MSHRIRFTWVLAGALGVLAAAGACRRGGGAQGVVTRTGGLTLEASLDPDPPRQKGNALRVTVKDAQGVPRDDAQVALRYFMPAMGAMQEMRGEAEVEQVGQGRYRARFDLPMDGTWTVDLDVRSGGASAQVSYRMTVGRRGLTASGSAPSARASEAGLPPQVFPPAVLASLRTALEAYEEARALLASDRVEGLDVPAAQASAALRAARSGVSGDPSGRIVAVMDETARAAGTLSQAGDLEKARSAFGELSRLLMILANCDPRLAEGWHVFSCPMAKGFNKWLQPTETLENPYMGQAMPTCGSPADWSVSGPRTPAEAEAHAESAHGTGSGEVAYYTCSMHPSVKKHEPGTCPICSMDLVPVTREELETGVIMVDAQRRQLIGVRTAVVESRPLAVTVRGVGKVVYDETRLSDVSLKYRGWIGTLYADAPGQLVRKGEPLFTLYSPELYTAQEEFLTVLASQKEARSTSAPDRADYLVEAARRRLSLWDLDDAEIDRIAARGRTERFLPITSPVTGYLVEKNVVEGAAVEPGMRLFRIAGLDRVWVEAEVYESELPLVSVGQEAEVSLPYLPGESFRGKVSFVYPYLEGPTRTGRVRIELPNRGLKLKPDMYATVTLRADRGQRPVVPEEAILYAGPRRLVFLDLGEGRLRPQEIQVGVKSGDVYEVLSGLKEGDRVVVSGNFLVGAESRLKSATGQW